MDRESKLLYCKIKNEYPSGFHNPSKESTERKFRIESLDSRKVIYQDGKPSESEGVCVSCVYFLEYSLQSMIRTQTESQEQS